MFCHRDTVVKADHREPGDYVVALAFLGVAGIAMVAWIAAIVWGSWQR